MNNTQNTKRGITIPEQAVWQLRELRTYCEERQEQPVWRDNMQSLDIAIKALEQEHSEMSYNSKCQLALTEADYKKNEKILEEVLSYKKEIVTPDEIYVILKNDFIQWDETDPKIKSIKDMMQKTRHSFIRVGETPGDIEIDNLTEVLGVGADEEFDNLLSVETIIITNDGMSVKDVLKKNIERANSKEEVFNIIDAIM